LNSVCRSYGFEKKSCPIIYTLEGTLIGSGADFVEHVRNRYDKSLTITKEQQKGRTKLNIMENEERMRKKREGDTLGEKIMKALGKVNEKEVSLHIDDAFYLKEVEGGLPFQVRRTDLLREKAKKGLSFGRCYDIPDEMELRANHLAAIEEVENTRDRTFEEFLEMFKDHIEGKKDPNDRVANRPDTAEAREAAKEKAEERERANESVEGSRKYQSIGSQGRASAASESKYSSQR